jgi:ABC-2 type transport system permease protein
VNWRQLQSILWLRWRLSRNQWTRGGVVNQAVMVFVTLAGIGVAAAGGVAGVLAGALVVGKAQPLTILLVWDGIIGAFLFFWLVGILTELQRSESIDIGRLLHLPVSLRDVFLLNYLASHFTLSLVIFLPGMIGLALGLIFGAGWRMVLLPPLVLSCIFTVTAWTYCLRGWLIALMTNQRRRRTILMAITMTIILLSQLPNLYFNVFHQGFHSGPRNRLSRGHGPNERSRFLPAFLAAHPFLPPLWVGEGAMGLANRRLLPALCASAGGLLIGGLGLMRAYRSTVRFYQGGASGKAVSSKRRAPVGRRAKSLFLETQLPFLPEESAALALALIRSMTRAPEVKLMMASNFIVLLLMAATFFSRASPAVNIAAKMFIATGTVAVPFFGLIQLMFNQFGLDREGFRALVLLPARRRHILLAKNVSFLPVALGMGLLLLAVAEVMWRLPASVVVSAVLQLGTIFLLLSMAGNLVSVLAPYRIAVGSLKPTKAPAKKMILIFVAHLLFPVAVAPALIPAGLGLLSAQLGWMPAVWVDLILSLLLAAGAAGLYWLSLETLGALLQRREMKVLQAVTQEIE